MYSETIKLKSEGKKLFERLSLLCRPHRQERWPSRWEICHMVRRPFQAGLYITDCYKFVFVVLKLERENCFFIRLVRICPVRCQKLLHGARCRVGSVLIIMLLEIDKIFLTHSHWKIFYIHILRFFPILPHRRGGWHGYFWAHQGYQLAKEPSQGQCKVIQIWNVVLVVMIEKILTIWWSLIFAAREYSTNRQQMQSTSIGKKCPRSPRRKK